MTSNKAESKRGFTVGEKWIIWGVFCLLIALSTHRFSVFAGLMLFSMGVSFFFEKRKIDSRNNCKYFRHPDFRIQ